MKQLSWINVGLRGLMETGIVLAFAYWGYQIGNGQLTKIVLCILVPLVGFGFWGLVDFHQFNKNAELFRLIQELIISFLAVVALYFSDQQFLAFLLGILSIIHHVLIYLTGEKLIKQ